MKEALKYTRQEHALSPFLFTMQTAREIKQRGLISLQGFSFVSVLMSWKACPQRQRDVTTCPRSRLLLQSIAYISSRGSDHCFRKRAIWELDALNPSYWAFIHTETGASLVPCLALEDQQKSKWLYFLFFPLSISNPKVLVHSTLFCRKK